MTIEKLITLLRWSVFKQSSNNAFICCLVVELLKMNFLLIKLFQFFGVFPFNIKNKKIRFSKFSYMWSILITTFFISISIKRCLYYYADNMTTFSYVFAMLTNYEPYFPCIEICLSTIPIYFSLKHLRRYIQNLVSLMPSSNGTNKKMIINVIIIILQCCVFIRMLQGVYFPTVELMSDIIDGTCSGIQTIFRKVHLLHFYVALNGMVEHLKRVERNLKNGQLKEVFDEYCKVLETYEELGMIYHFFMIYSLFDVFYDTMSGVKKLQDFLFNHYGEEAQSDDVEGFIIWWWLFLVPILMLVLHEGHLVHEKVLIYLPSNTNIRLSLLYLA